MTAVEQESIPDRSSVPLKETVTSVLFQPLQLAAGEAVAVAVGAVLSMLMPVLLSLAALPALSVQVPVADELIAPSVLHV